MELDLTIVEREGRRFAEMVAEEQQGDDFRVFGDRGAAEAWLLSL